MNRARQETWDALTYPHEIAQVKTFINRHLNSAKNIPVSEFTNISEAIKTHLPADRVEMHLDMSTYKVKIYIDFDGKEYILKFDY